ncbi:hypothetical protein CPB84DRAFT_1493021 [Gymnopilus junonius]|uniref:non-specific serine/threonine protein kinase n=1 Tax=Gymnopilus junonius TaxID=109634 RepID=A0A9P5NGY9_GYMJU|nr:hypothetical protein CPB84DRAFT_1493021 [Gymnopilus junonius]
MPWTIFRRVGTDVQRVLWAQSGVLVRICGVWLVFCSNSSLAAITSSTPASGTRYSKNDDHIAQIIELLGEIPKSIAFSGKYPCEFINRKKLRHTNKLRYWPLESVLHDKYLIPLTRGTLL